MKSWFVAIAAVTVWSCSFRSAADPLSVSEAQRWAPGCYKGAGSILTPGRPDSAESVWLIIRTSHAKERFTHPWFKAEFVGSDTASRARPARWTSFGPDTLEVTWHDGFSG